MGSAVPLELQAEWTLTGHDKLPKASKENTLVSDWQNLWETKRDMVNGMPCHSVLL